MEKNCLAKQIGDQHICQPCGLAWDCNDPEPPACRRAPRPIQPAPAAIPPPALEVPRDLSHCGDCGAELFKDEIQYNREHPELSKALCAPCFRKRY